MRKQMAGFRNFVIGCALSAASIMTPVASAQAAPFAFPDVKIDRYTDVQYRRDYGGYGGSYRDYRPYYGYRPYSRYQPYYGYRPRPYYQPYYRPGVSVYVTPRPYYRDRYVRRGYSSHVDWCLARYRSYDPATDRFLTYGGVSRICYSPYR
jgi:hypothetical protein